ncbi:unnamed protein product [Rhizophagus irregularis]|nr:unnamed protein product [Rhizophagus irregularis]
MILTILANDDNSGNDNNNRYNEKEDPRYITQTYKFSLDTLNEVYNDLINNRSRLLDISSYNYFAKFRI